MSRTEQNTWFIGSTVKSSGQTTSLTVTRSRLHSQPWAYITLESTMTLLCIATYCSAVYAVNSCQEFPTKSVTFSNLQLFEERVQVTPDWNTFQTQKLCGDEITVNSAA